MPLKSEKPAKEKKEESLQAFFYPTIGDGVTIWAKDQDDANKKAAKLQADIASQSSPKVNGQ